jgi:hypothetical protein
VVELVLTEDGPLELDVDSFINKAPAATNKVRGLKSLSSRVSHVVV